MTTSAVGDRPHRAVDHRQSRGIRSPASSSLPPYVYVVPCSVSVYGVFRLVTGTMPEAVVPRDGFEATASRC